MTRQRIYNAVKAAKEDAVWNIVAWSRYSTNDDGEEYEYQINKSETDFYKSVIDLFNDVTVKYRDKIAILAVLRTGCVCPYEMSPFSQPKTREAMDGYKLAEQAYRKGYMECYVSHGWYRGGHIVRIHTNGRICINPYTH